MKNLLNFGVSDPLTLGMSHPVADRLETLGREKTLTNRGRATVLGIMGGLAVLSAPFTLAADNPPPREEIKYKFVSSEDGINNQGFEIVSEDGQERAYTFSENGERVPAQLEQLEDGTKRIHLSDGQIIDLPNITGFEKLKGLGDLARLEGFEDLKKLEALADFEGLAHFTALKEIEIDGQDLDTYVFNSVKSGEELSEEILAKFPESLQELFNDANGTKEIKILKNGKFEAFDFSELDGETITLPDTVVDLNFAFVSDKDPLAQALRQIERTERQLSKLAEDETLTYDLENAMRDLESARKSLEAAEARLEQEK